MTMRSYSQPRPKHIASDARLFCLADRTNVVHSMVWAKSGAHAIQLARDSEDHPDRESKLGGELYTAFEEPLKGI